MSKWLTLEETATELELTYGTVRQYVHCGKIRAIKVGKNRMVSWNTIVEWREKKTAKC